MPELIKCRKMKKDDESFSFCLNCTKRIVFARKEDAYIQCPYCGAVMYDDKLIPCEIAEEIFPDDIKVAY